MRHNNQHLRIKNTFPPDVYAVALIRQANDRREDNKVLYNINFAFEQARKGRIVARLGK